ncbi:N(6)-adenine-specific methyltransferase METTL4 [Eupeodes corollae]|uniref:N(6)-adenine-specific methyltransferase METTL4 n=1 Tax=Eupeodes corollae TaxID=290404 RepID=UPI002493A316|nr:N(6)-adenine-specific methyltransferase METTL4 [Eupeodes corollae]
MIKINSSEWTAIYLVHNELIYKSYNDYVECNQTYKLKPQLFDFSPKVQKTTDVEVPASKSKARKRKLGIENVNLLPETIELKQSCEFLVTKLKELTENFKYFQRNNVESLSRIWEEPIVFPKLHGANARNNFQTFNLNNQEYLIPPHCQFFNHDLLKLEEISASLTKFDFVVIDPPWKNKYIKRIKKAKQELGYKMLDNDILSDIPLSSFIHCDSIVAVWCTNSNQHQQKLLNEFFPRWDLKLIHKIIWLKLNTAGSLICDINDDNKKQPYEVLFIASHNESKRDVSEKKKLKYILSVPSIIHSHKPPILEIFRDILPPNPNSLELFARYLQPGFTSIGLEVLKLMDTRLYGQNNKERISL